MYKFLSIQAVAYYSFLSTSLSNSVKLQLRIFTTITLIGTGLVLILNALGALAAKWFGFDVANLAIPSVLLYFAIGYIASRVMPILHTLIALVIIALIEVGVGWLLSPWLQLGTISFG